MKKLLVLLFVLSGMIAHAQFSNCGFAQSLNNGLIERQSTSDLDYWSKFVATQLNHSIIIWEEIDSMPPDIIQAEIYSGTCSGQILLATANANFDGSVVLNNLNLVIGQEYYVHVLRGGPSECRTCLPPLKSMNTYVTVTPCTDMVYNGSF